MFYKKVFSFFVFPFCLTVLQQPLSATVSIENKEDKNSILVLDNISASDKPVNFRTAKMLEENYKNKGNTFGLNKLKVSGSGQFSSDSLQWIIKNTIGNVKNNFIVVDLREESHGFVNGTPISWLPSQNKALNIKSFPQDEELKIKELSEKKQVKIPTATSFKENGFEESEEVELDIKNTISEETLLKNNNISYQRFKVTDRSIPTDEEIEKFVSFVKNLNDDTWVHFHCHAGKGRATSFLVMYDMLKNSNKVAFEDIINRQAATNSSNNLLTHIKQDKSEIIEKRAKFLKSFYLYTKALDNNYKGKWREWVLNSIN
ncbi:fused DSP-PTPase phosphatase/NAD kinase-like protein [Fluviispira multicolorata]|uniref:Phosphatase n=1 Tax=Fluviispira multicolorata TaxID=2654512 RepID=A0A833JB96_9BACT|nr:phosphatase [Fluviispira multicolorata]KAB8029089.1 phosphatase [Fluviispira multicolorata]